MYFCSEELSFSFGLYPKIGAICRPKEISQLRFKNLNSLVKPLGIWKSPIKFQKAFFQRVSSSISAPQVLRAHRAPNIDRLRDNRLLNVHANELVLFLMKF